MNKSKKESPEENIHKLLHGSSSDKLVEPQEKPEVPSVQLPTAIPAQSKFGPASTVCTRSFVSANLQNYLKKHERFVHILDSVEKYLSDPTGYTQDFDEILQSENP